MYEQFFLHFPNLFFLKQTMHSFNYFLCFHITIIISITLKNDLIYKRKNCK